MVLESGVTVGAVVVVNAAGDVVDPATGLPWMNLSDRGVRPDRAAGRPDRSLAARDAELQPAEHHHRGRRHRRRAEPGRRAGASPSPPTTGWPAPSGPCHTPLDGDTVFALATGAVDVPPEPTHTGVDVAGDDADHRGRSGRGRLLARAVLVGVLAAESVAGIPTYRDLLPGAFE